MSHARPSLTPRPAPVVGWHPGCPSSHLSTCGRTGCDHTALVTVRRAFISTFAFLCNTFHCVSIGAAFEVPRKLCGRVSDIFVTLHLATRRCPRSVHLFRIYEYN